jgi:DNA-nicking Smr family endonuclease
MNPDDKSLFLDAMEDVQPLKRARIFTGSPAAIRGRARRWIPNSWITS